jgi:hypothetical protein
MVFLAVALRIIITKGDVNYPVGTDLGGIKWQDSFSDVRVTISNKTTNNYDDTNLY